MSLTSMAAHGAPTDDVIGLPSLYVTVAKDTLLDVARSYDLGYVEIRAANPGIDPWLPGAGKTLKLPTQHVRPDAPHRGIVINLPELRLYYFPAQGAPVSFPIGIGGEGKETPVGHTRVVAKRVHPTWIPTKSEHEENPDLPAVVPPGPDNPMGDYALYLGWQGYAIHGTDRPYSIGRRDSHGCIRLYPEDIEKLFHLVAVGTPVAVVDQPAKAGWTGGMLYLEIHPKLSDADSLESQGKPRSSDPIDAEAVVLKAAGEEADDLDWHRIGLAERQRSGIAVPVMRR
jgi:L,D-transpeptidase ErfK/SrfK